MIRAKQKKVAAAFGDADDLVILIKATHEASYRNMVDALDEMKIHRVARYALVDITSQEVSMLDAWRP